MRDDELAFADQIGRFYARYYGAPPMTGRVAGWLLICDPPEQTAAEVADALRVSRSAIGTAIAALERWGAVQRIRPPGERADRVRAHPDFAMLAVESTDEYAALAALARQGLELLGGAPRERKGRLVELVAFTEFLVERMPALAAEWRRRRDALRAGESQP
jgi:hypothetical protein